MIYLDLETLMLIARRALNAAEPVVRDHGLLGSALFRPQTDAFGHEVYPTLAGKAAALLHSLVLNHALLDGNKRLGWAATVVFCDINGHFLEMDDDEAYGLVIAVAKHDLEVEDIAVRIQEAFNRSAR
jgi:death-on-curing protein